MSSISALGNKGLNLLQEFGLLSKDQIAELQKKNSGSELGAVSSSLTSSNNVMSNNFFTLGGRESELDKRREAGKQALTAQATRQNAILTSAIAELNTPSSTGGSGYARRILIGKQAARKIKEEMGHSVREEFEKNLKVIKENLDKKTEEVTAPKDKDGNPIDEYGKPINTTGTTTVPPPTLTTSAPSSTPAPSTPAPAPEVSLPGTGSESSGGDAAPAQPSINIVV